MGLLKKFFGGRDAAPEEPPASSQFHESETTAQEQNSRNAPHRELVHVVLRDTMRKHGIPSDWIESRILSVVMRNRMSGMHVQFIIGKEEPRLRDYVHAFQDSFWTELEKFDPRARDWLFSVAWQFDGPAPPTKDSLPGPSGWHGPDSGWQGQDSGMDGDTQPPEIGADELASDLRALYAIRDAALSQPADTAPMPPAPSPPDGREDGAGR
jgi:hypothetical protein